MWSRVRSKTACVPNPLVPHLNTHFCYQALGVCSQSDRSALKKKLKEMRKREEKDQRRGAKRLKEEKDKENVDVDSDGKEKSRMMSEGKPLKDERRSGKTVRTESLLWRKDWDEMRCTPPAWVCVFAVSRNQNYTSTELIETSRSTEHMRRL